jgi:hypothetical protein
MSAGDAGLIWYAAGWITIPAPYFGIPAGFWCHNILRNRHATGEGDRDASRPVQLMREARIWYSRDTQQETLPGAFENEVVLSDECVFRRCE